jgi:hypothetical protein
MPPDIMPLPALNQLELEQQFLHATMPSASNFYNPMPSNFYNPMPSGFHGPMQAPSGFHAPMPVPSGFRAPIPHAIQSLDQQVVMELQFLRSEIAKLKNMIFDAPARYTTLLYVHINISILTMTDS